MALALWSFFVSAEKNGRCLLFHYLLQHFYFFIWHSHQQISNRHNRFSNGWCCTIINFRHFTNFFLFPFVLSNPKYIINLSFCTNSNKLSIISLFLSNCIYIILSKISLSLILILFYDNTFFKTSLTPSWVTGLTMYSLNPTVFMKKSLLSLLTVCIITGVEKFF